MVTTKKIPVEVTQREEESKYINIENVLVFKRKTAGERKKRNYKTKFFLNGNSKSFSINNYFKCKWIKCSNQKRMAEWIKTRPIYMLLTTDSFQI